MQAIPMVAAMLLGVSRVSSPADVVPEPRCEVTAEIERGELVARCGKKELFRTAFAEKVVVPEKERLEPATGGEEYIADEFAVAGDLVIVHRGVHVLGAFCHTPRVERVDVFAKDGRFRTYVKDDAAIFSGRVLASPDGEWAVVLQSGEGVLYGYAVLDASGAIVDDAKLARAVYDEGGEFAGDTFVIQSVVISRDGTAKE